MSMHERIGLSSSSPMHERLGEHLSAVSEHFGTPTHVTLGAGAVIVVLLLALILTLFRSTFSSRSSSRPAKRTPLPAFAFDVEGGSHSASNGSGKALHPSIAQAAANADVATLRNWIGEWQCLRCMRIFR